MSILNPAQRQAVAYVDGPLLVLAGAGSGKTRVITEKIAQLVESGRYNAKHIAAITFTNKAAREMRERLGKRLRGETGEGLTICTFHALGLKMLQIEHARAGLKRGFSIFDSDDQLGLIKDLLPAGSKADAVQAMLGLISSAKNQGLDPEQAQAASRSLREREAAAIYQRYQQRLAAFNAVDFDDLIRLPLSLLENDAELAGGWRERIRYLLVDECQDSNDAQYRLLKQLAGSRGAFTCVGDDDQSIYAWRGARPENLERMGVDYPALKVIKLEQNYRCAARILRCANALIANNPHLHPKALWSDQRDGDKPRIWSCRDAEHEAERVASEIHYLHHARELPWGEFAVLFRGNHQSRPIEKALQLLRIPYHLTGGTAFLQRGEVKDALSWLRVIVNPDDDAAFLRAIAAPARGVGASTLEKLAELAQSHDRSMLLCAEQASVLKVLPARSAASLHEFIDIIRELRRDAERMTPTLLVQRLIERSGLLEALRAQCKDKAAFERRRENLDELANWFDHDAQAGLTELAAKLALLNHADRSEPGNAVRLMSLHGSKGLEFSAVFLIGMEDGNLPHEASIDEGRLDEERRLLYVGITRAKHILTLSHCAEVKRWGEKQHLLPSRFFNELPASDIARDGSDPQAEADAKKQRGRAHLDAIAALFDSDNSRQ